MSSRNVANVFGARTEAPQTDDPCNMRQADALSRLGEGLRASTCLSAQYPTCTSRQLVLKIVCRAQCRPSSVQCKRSRKYAIECGTLMRPSCKSFRGIPLRPDKDGAIAVKRRAVLLPGRRQPRCRISSQVRRAGKNAGSWSGEDRSCRLG